MKYKTDKEDIIFTPEDDLDCFDLGVISQKAPNQSEFTSATDTPTEMKYLKMGIKDLFKLARKSN